jgi:hypothetical protein
MVAARIYESDRAIQLTLAPGHTLVVLGYLRDPFVRITSGSVEVNTSAPTAGGAGLLARLPSHAAGWRRLSQGQSVTWHDNRLRALPPAIERARWEIPLIVSGHPASLEGEIWRVDAPVWWPWLLVGLPFVAVSLLVYLRRRSALRSTAAAFGLVAGAGMIASAAGFAFDTYGSGGKWVEFGDSLVFVAVGAAVIARGSPNARAIAGGALGLLGLWVGLTKLPVFRHGVVLSVFPPTTARALVALTVWAALAATSLGLVVYANVLDQGDETAEPRSV